MMSLGNRAAGLLSVSTFALAGALAGCGSNDDVVLPDPDNLPERGEQIKMETQGGADAPPTPTPTAPAMSDS